MVLASFVAEDNLTAVALVATEVAANRTVALVAMATDVPTVVLVATVVRVALKVQ